MKPSRTLAASFVLAALLPLSVLADSHAPAPAPAAPAATPADKHAPAMNAHAPAAAPADKPATPAPKAAMPKKPAPKAAVEKPENAQLKAIIQNLLEDNDLFVKAHNPEYFKPFTDGQHPRATVVTCSDSRVHTHAFDKSPDGDLFMVRNIGNQLSSAEGSVEYGVHHLHTPLLIFIGHTACGAIKAASGDYSGESVSIKRELVTIQIARGGDVLEGVKTNVHNQVAAALKKFSEEVKERKLAVVGAVYDFRDDLRQGQGRLVLINLNGETDPLKIRQSSLLSTRK